MPKECNHRFHKAGFMWSGRKQIQRWRCNICGLVTTNPDKYKVK